VTLVGVTINIRQPGRYLNESVQGVPRYVGEMKHALPGNFAFPIPHIALCDLSKNDRMD